jgi:hypothetical protein
MEGELGLVGRTVAAVAVGGLDDVTGQGRAEPAEIGRREIRVEVTPGILGRDVTSGELNRDPDRLTRKESSGRVVERDIAVGAARKRGQDSAREALGRRVPDPDPLARISVRTGVEANDCESTISSIDQVVSGALLRHYVEFDHDARAGKIDLREGRIESTDTRRR